MKDLNNEIKFQPVTERSYDGSRLQFPEWWYAQDDPFYIPTQIAIDNPELYAKLVEQRRKNIEAFTPKNCALKSVDGIKGKAVMFGTLIDEDKNSNFKNIWDAVDNEDNGLKRFFLPAWSRDMDEGGI